MKLGQAVKGSKHKILQIEGDSIVIDRLFEMGFAPNEEVEVLQQLLWSGPLIVSIRSTQVALRFNEAQCIEIQPLTT